MKGYKHEITRTIEQNYITYRLLDSSLTDKYKLIYKPSYWTSHLKFKKSSVINNI